MTIVWLEKQALLLLHDISLSDHGGSSGLRDEGLLDSALARPRNLLAHGDPDVPSLAAAYGFGLAKNHPFVDGNKRAAFLAIGVFLARNGWRLEVDQAEAIRVIFDLAAGAIDEERLASWLRDHVVAVTDG